VQSIKLPEYPVHSTGLLLGVCYDGEFNSYFIGNKNIKTNPDNIILRSKHTKLILLGNGEFIKDKFYPPYENFEFITGLLDYITD